MRVCHGQEIQIDTTVKIPFIQVFKPKMAELALQQAVGSQGVTTLKFTTICTSNPIHISLSIHINYIKNIS
jgi:hypothetical protein